MAAALIEGARASIRCYDVRVACTERLFEHQLSIERTIKLAGREISVPRYEYVSWEDAKMLEYRYRQVYRDEGKYPMPLRRVEEFSLDTSQYRRSILTFDGTARRSFYKEKMRGLVSGPPDSKHQFVNYMFDYMTIVAMRVPADYELLSDLARSLPPDKIEIKDENGSIFLHLHPSAPKSAVRDGYRIWFDRKHGLMPRELHQYASTPDWTEDLDDNKATWGEHNSLEILVDHFQPIEGGRWAPLRVSIKVRHDRGEYVGALIAQADISVDPDASTWNVDPPLDEFTFDFPVGTRVTDELRSVVFVVGDKDAGRNLDELIANAKQMMPTAEEGRKLAGWDKPRADGYHSTFLGRALILENAVGLLGLLSLLIWRLRRRRDAAAGQ